MYSIFEEVLHEADLKYIKLFLENNWSIDKIKAKTKLDADYLNEIISEINSQKKSN